MPTKNREKKVGSRTTVRVMGREWIFKERDEILIHTYNDKSYLKSDLKNYNKSRQLRESKMYVSKNEEINSFFGPLLGGMMTNGFRAVIIALSICDEVIIYGGDPSGAVSAESGGSIKKFPSEKEKKLVKRMIKKWNVNQNIERYFEPIDSGEQSEKLHSTLKNEYEFYRLHPRVTVE
jgi:hypothetical protein